MKKVLIIGGGLAGLSAASILSSKNYSVTVLESSPKLGGRTFSFQDKKFDSVIDNGQHILMGCYKDTLSFLKLIGAQNKFDYQKNLELDFITEERFIYSLKANKLFYPFNLLYAVLKYDAFEFDDKIKFISFVIKLPFLSKRSLEKLSVKDWLKLHNQSSNTIKMFWEILCVAAMNTNLEKASALYFYKILVEIFFKGNFASTIILPKFGLSESFINPAKDFIISNGGKIFCSETVKEISLKNTVVNEVKTLNNSYKEYDFIISAIPLHSLQKLIGLDELEIKLELEYSTIVNIHIWSDGFDFDKRFIGLLDSHLHWIFKKDDHFNIVISDADYLAEKSKEEIIHFAAEELSKYINLDISKIKSYKILKEKRATFIPSNKILNHRPKSRTKIKNLFLAGDWIDTDLPATIESAVKRGRIAAESVLNLD